MITKAKSFMERGIRSFLLFVILLSVLGAGRWAVAQDLTVVTALWAPYEMIEDDKLTGMGTEIVQATLARAGVQTEIQEFPLARALMKMKETPNMLLYTIVKTPEREPLFHWVGPIIPHVRIVMHKLRKRTDIVLNSLDDARKYRIGTTREAVGHQYLLQHGFEDEKHIEAVNSNSQSIQKFFLERVDLEVSEEMNFLYQARQQGFDSADTEVALVLYENQGYMVLSRQTPENVVERVRIAFEQIRAAGIVDAIISRYAGMYR